jgi:glycosyltransferase involved in cell wall biosynthesis
LLLVASNNSANHRNLIWLFDQVLPILGDLIQEQQPRLVQLPLPEINLCGSIAAALPPKLSPLVKVHGIVPDLRAHYEASDVVLLPIITGGGVAIKTIEALLYERPVVATRHALRGLPSEIADIVGSENDPEAYARQILELLRSQRARDHQTARVRKAAQRLREERFYDRLASAMEMVRL